MKKNQLLITARDAIVRIVSENKISATKSEIKGFIDFITETGAFVNDLTVEDFELKHAKGRLSKSRLESIKKGLKIKNKLLKADDRLGTGEGVFDLMIETTWRNSPDLQAIVDEVLVCAGKNEGIIKIPNLDSNNMVNDPVVIGYANRLGVDKREFIEHLMLGVYTGQYKK